MTMYQIKPLHIDRLNQLQTAVLEGAFSARVNLLRTGIEANKGFDPVVNDLEKQLVDLREAARAIMDAAPQGSIADQLSEVCKRECMGDYVMMMRSDYETLTTIALDLKANSNLDTHNVGNAMSEPLDRVIRINWKVSA